MPTTRRPPPRPDPHPRLRPSSPRSARSLEPSQPDARGRVATRALQGPADQAQRRLAQPPAHGHDADRRDRDDDHAVTDADMAGDRAPGRGQGQVGQAQRHVPPLREQLAPAPVDQVGQKRRRGHQRVRHDGQPPRQLRIHLGQLRPQLGGQVGGHIGRQPGRRDDAQRQFRSGRRGCVDGLHASVGDLRHGRRRQPERVGVGLPDAVKVPVHPVPAAGRLIGGRPFTLVRSAPPASRECRMARAWAMRKPPGRKLHVLSDQPAAARPLVVRCLGGDGVKWRLCAQRPARPSRMKPMQARFVSGSRPGRFNPPAREL